MSHQPPDTNGVDLSDRKRVFGRFLCQEKLESNPPFELWRARTQGLAGFERAFAVKALPARAPDTHPDASRRLTEAGSRAIAIRDPRIAQVVDCGTSPDGTAYVVTEFVFGSNLAALGSLLRSNHEQTRLPAALPTLLSHLGAEIAAGLATAHAATPPMVHGALCPTNIILTIRGRVKLLDFGLRDAIIDPYSSSRRRNLSPYAAPELLLAGGASVEADLFALGALLFELVTGEAPPSARNPKSGTELGRALEGVTPALRETIVRLVKADPAQRLSAKHAAEWLRNGTTPLSETELRSELGALARRLDLSDPRGGKPRSHGAQTTAPTPHEDTSESSDPAAGFAQIPTRNIFRDGFADQKTAPGVRLQSRAPHLASKARTDDESNAGFSEQKTASGARPTPRSPIPVPIPARTAPGRSPPPQASGFTVPKKGIPPLPPPPSKQAVNLAAQFAQSTQRSQPATFSPLAPLPISRPEPGSPASALGRKYGLTPMPPPKPGQQALKVTTFEPSPTREETATGIEEPRTVELDTSPLAHPPVLPTPPVEADPKSGPRQRTNTSQSQILSMDDLEVISDGAEEPAKGGAEASQPVRVSPDLESKKPAPDGLDMNQLTKGEVDAMFAAGIHDTAEELARVQTGLDQALPKVRAEEPIAHITDEHPDFYDEASMQKPRASHTPAPPPPSPRAETHELSEETPVPATYARKGPIIVVLSALCAAGLGIGALTVLRGNEGKQPAAQSAREPVAPESVTATPEPPKATEPVATTAPEPIAPEPVATAPEPTVSEPVAAAPEPKAPEPVAPESAASAATPEAVLPKPAPAPVAATSKDEAKAPATRNAEGLLEFEIVTVPPGAEIWINGGSRGLSPVRVALRDRHRKLAIVRPGYETLITELDHDTLPKQRTFTLQRLPAWPEGSARISVECERAGQYPIFIDKRETGFLCPMEIAVTPGPHRVEIYVPWRFSRYEIRAKVAAGETQSVRFSK